MHVFIKKSLIKSKFHSPNTESYNKKNPRYLLEYYCSSHILEFCTDFSVCITKNLFKFFTSYCNATQVSGKTETNFQKKKNIKILTFYNQIFFYHFIFLSDFFFYNK